MSGEDSHTSIHWQQSQSYNHQLKLGSLLIHYMSVYDDLETVWDSVEVPGVSCLMTLSSQVFLSHVPTPQLSPGHAWPSWRQTYCHSYHQLHNSECQVLHMKIVETLFENGHLRCKPNHWWLIQKQPTLLIMDWNLVEATSVYISDKVIHF